MCSGSSNCHCGFVSLLACMAGKAAFSPDVNSTMRIGHPDPTQVLHLQLIRMQKWLALPRQVVLHPKSVYQVPGVWHGVAELDGFHSGVELLRGEAAREEVLDRVRFFAEDCDSLQVGTLPAACQIASFIARSRLLFWPCHGKAATGAAGDKRESFMTGSCTSIGFIQCSGP